MEKSSKKIFSDNTKIVRAACIEKEPFPDYDRFIPKQEFIKDDNRFSPKGKEWIYLAFADKNQDKIAEECALKECRAKPKQHYALCDFELSKKYRNEVLVDLTIAKEYSFFDINEKFEKEGEKIVKRAVNEFVSQSHKKIFPTPKVDDIKYYTKEWAIYTYAKLMSEQLFLPLKTEDKNYIYAPFHCLGQYFYNKGYCGIVYSSTVFPEGNNVVFFDKYAVKPTGDIEDFIIPDDFI